VGVVRTSCRADLAERQLRVDELAAKVFAAAGWHGPLPPLIVDPTLSGHYPRPLRDPARPTAHPNPSAGPRQARAGAARHAASQPAAARADDGALTGRGSACGTTARQQNLPNSCRVHAGGWSAGR
jgi:hypothetical protein